MATNNERCFYCGEDLSPTHGDEWSCVKRVTIDNPIAKEDTMALIEDKRISAEVEFDGESGRWRVSLVESTDNALGSPTSNYFNTRNRSSRYAHNLKNKYSSVSILE